MILVWSRWGILVPAFAVGGAVVSALVSRQTGIDPHAAAWLGPLAGGLAAGGGLYLATRKIEDGSGYVYYDAQNDCPVVVDESPGTFWGAPMKAWAVILPLLGVLFAILAAAGVDLGEPSGS
ncbi:hypothetical protein [Caulobacter sp. 17J65-9]|uniref:hypothetical protein n=1 Tax=Caulobacter sp. 17J65-9 TaxID=2709382 RepID=UPI0013CB8AFF|nr:hypothetical protein [Caulobacter sp. 17J65-9]NEX94051.1 hypothetical protein [Caulobacter sp. 17J65-9]